MRNIKIINISDSLLTQFKWVDTPPQFNRTMYCEVKISLLSLKRMKNDVNRRITVYTYLVLSPVDQEWAPGQ